MPCTSWAFFKCMCFYKRESSTLFHSKPWCLVGDSGLADVNPQASQVRTVIPPRTVEGLLAKVVSYDCGVNRITEPHPPRLQLETTAKHPPPSPALT